MSVQTLVHNDKLFVTCKGDNTVQVVNVLTGAVDSIIPVGSQPYIIVLSTDGSRALVANYDSGTVSVIDTASYTVINTFNVEHGPTGIAFSNDNSMAYVSNAFSFCISIYNVATGDRIVTVPAVQPAGIALGEDGMVFAVDTGRNSLLIIDPAAGLLNATIPMGDSYNGIAFVPGGPALLSSTTDGNVSFFDLATRNVTDMVHVGNGPYGIAVNPYHQAAYITNMNGNTVAVLDLDARAVRSTVSVGKMPAGVAVSEDGQRVYVANSGGDSISVINATTLKVLRAFPAQKSDYKPHDRSNSALQLAWTMVVENEISIAALEGPLELKGFPKPQGTYEEIVAAREASAEQDAEEKRRGGHP
jgi:YVTN family beta-propeller protein